MCAERKCSTFLFGFLFLEEVLARFPRYEPFFLGENYLPPSFILVIGSYFNGFLDVLCIMEIASLGNCTYLADYVSEDKRGTLLWVVGANRMHLKEDWWPFKEVCELYHAGSIDNRFRIRPVWVCSFCAVCLQTVSLRASHLASLSLGILSCNISLRITLGYNG